MNFRGKLDYIRALRYSCAPTRVLNLIASKISPAAEHCKIKARFNRKKKIQKAKIRVRAHHCSAKSRHVACVAWIFRRPTKVCWRQKYFTWPYKAYARLGPRISGDHFNKSNHNKRYNSSTDNRREPTHCHRYTSRIYKKKLTSNKRNPRIPAPPPSFSPSLTAKIKREG